MAMQHTLLAAQYLPPSVHLIRDFSSSLVERVVPLVDHYPDQQEFCPLHYWFAHLHLLTLQHELNPSPKALAAVRVALDRADQCPGTRKASAEAKVLLDSLSVSRMVSVSVDDDDEFDDYAD